MKLLSMWLEQEPPTFLEYCRSLTKIIVKTKNDNLNNIEWVGKLPNLRRFSLVSVFHPVEINRSNVSFLTDKKITEVRIKDHIFRAGAA